jgi:hypothetical protein
VSFTQPVPAREAGFSILKMRFITVVTLLFLSVFLSISAHAATLVVDDNATECPAAGFSTIQAAINAAAPADTIQVCAGTYAEQLNINKPLTVLGPNTGIDPNVGPRVAEAVIIPTTSDPLNPGFAGPIVVTFGVSGITFRGFTVDGDNPALTSGVLFNGADVDAEFGIYGTETANPDVVIINNIVKNIGEISIFITSNSQGGAKNANSQISNNKVDNNLGNYGEGIRISDDAWVSVMNNYVSRLRLGIVIENYSGNTTTHPASVISGNNISAFRIGIWHNLHYVYTAPGFTISQNTVTAYVQTPLPPQVTTPVSYQGIRVESIQQNVFVDVNDNILNGNRTALVGAGYTRDEGLNVTNASTTSPNIAFRRNNVSDFIRGVFHQTPAVPLFESNAITGSTFGIVNDAAATNGLVAHFNRITGNGTGMQNNAAATINAENNWWGCNYGPGATGAGCSSAANSASGPIDADPWLTLRTSASPTLIGVGGTSNVTSTLIFNSANANTSGSGTVQNGTPASFAGTLGTVAPPTGTTTAGVTGTVFTATAFGSGNAATTIDTQTVNAAILIDLPCLAVSVPSGITTPRNVPVTVPINVGDTTGRGIISYDYTFTYNPAVVTYTGVDQTGTLSSGMTVTINSNTPGTLIISGFQANPISGMGQLIKLNFTAVGPIGSNSALSLPAFMFNEGTPCSTTSNGSVTIISGTVSGVVSYSNSMTFKPVPNTTLTGTGSLPTVSTNSAFFTGAYSLGGFGPGPYTVTPSKTGDANGISGFDSGLIAQHVVNLITLNATQLLAADVSQAAGVTSFDAGLIARYVVALPNSGVTGSWIFNPTSLSYPDVETNKVNQDYGAILMGEVSGDWVAPTSFAPFAEPSVGKNLNPEAIVTVTAPQHVTPAGLPFTVPVSTTDLSIATTGIDVISYQFILTYNNAIIQPQTPAVTVAGTISENRSVTVNQLTPGILSVVVFGSDPMIGAGTLFNFKFNAVGSPGQISPLTWQTFQFNEGNPDDNTVNGQVRLTVLSSANASVGGRVLTALGQAVPKARVTMTDVQGHTRSVLSNPMGYYRFDDLEVGQTYFVQVSAKRFRFNTQVVSVSGDLTELDLIANPSEDLSP